jgi:hypothetical protein
LLRIGVPSGPYFYENDALGDGINIAAGSSPSTRVASACQARLQSVLNKVDFQAERGRVSLKNISRKSTLTDRHPERGNSTRTTTEARPAYKPGSYATLPRSEPVRRPGARGFPHPTNRGEAEAQALHLTTSGPRRRLSVQRPFEVRIYGATRKP